MKLKEALTNPINPTDEEAKAAEAALRHAIVTAHPLYPIFYAAIEQAAFGKGERHGGAATPFLEQPWHHYGKMHGRGFLTGQAAKKLEEAASTRFGTEFEREVLGAIVYAGMSIIHEREASTRLSPGGCVILDQKEGGNV